MSIGNFKLFIFVYKIDMNYVSSICKKKWNYLIFDASFVKINLRNQYADWKNKFINIMNNKSPLCHDMPYYVMYVWSTAIWILKPKSRVPKPKTLRFYKIASINYTCTSAVYLYTFPFLCLFQRTLCLSCTSLLNHTYEMKYQAYLVRSEILNKYPNSCLILHSEAAVSGKVSCSEDAPHHLLLELFLLSW